MATTRRGYHDPPEEPEPFENCWECNESLWLDDHGDIEYYQVGDQRFYCCMEKECIEQIMYEAGKGGMSVEEFDAHHLETHHEPTEQELRSAEIEAKIDQKLFEGWRKNGNSKKGNS